MLLFKGNLDLSFFSLFLILCTVTIFLNFFFIHLLLNIIKDLVSFFFSFKEIIGQIVLSFSYVKKIFHYFS